MATPHVCPCGSGEPCWPLKDGYGIFMAYVCDHCHSEKLSHFRADIFERYQTDEPIEEE